MPQLERRQAADDERAHVIARFQVHPGPTTVDWEQVGLRPVVDERPVMVGVQHDLGAGGDMRIVRLAALWIDVLYCRNRAKVPVLRTEMCFGPLIADESLSAFVATGTGSKGAYGSARRAELARLRSSASAAAKSWPPINEQMNF